MKNFWSFLLNRFLSVSDKNFCNPLYLCIRTSLLSTCTIRTIRFYLIAAAKINQLLLLFQIFLPLFYGNYEDLLPPTLRSTSYNRNFFYNRRIQGTEKEREKGEKKEEGGKREDKSLEKTLYKPHHFQEKGGQGEQGERKEKKKTGKKRKMLFKKRSRMRKKERKKEKRDRRRYIN